MQNNTTIKLGNKTTGVIYGEVLRIEKLDKSHYVEKFKGYGVSPSTLHDAERKGAKYLQLIGYDGEVFYLSIRQFIAAAIPATLNPKFGEQLFLSVKWLRWYTDHKPTYTNEPQPARLHQPTLFG